MKKETFEEAREIQGILKKNKDILDLLQVDKGQLSLIMIRSRIKETLSTDFEIRIKNGTFFKEGLGEKTREMIAILSETYRDQVIALIKRNRKELEDEFEKLEDLS